MNQFRPQRFEILPLVVKNLLIINGLTFLATLVFKSAFNTDLISILGLHFFSSELFMPHQLITHMFMHGSFIHIFSNMFALWMFGSALENVWGPKRFLFFYFSCGLGGAFMHLGVTWHNVDQMQTAVSIYQSQPGLAEFATLMTRYDYLLNNEAVQQFIDLWKANPGSQDYLRDSLQIARSLTSILADVPIVGASGAVFGVLVAFGMLFPNTYLYVYFFFPIKAKYFVILYAAFELYAGLSGTQSTIAHFAHLGGALVGFLLVRFWNRNMRRNFY